MKPKYLLFIYVIVSVLEIFSEWASEVTGNRLMVYVLKPVMMPLLIYAYYSFSSKMFNGFHKLIIVAFIFSWFGDLFLLVTHINEEVMFLLGLVSFLVAHILYFAAFTKTFENYKQGHITKEPGFIILMLGYGMALMAFLFTQAHPKFDEMQIPVLIYASVILSMVLMAYNRKGLVNPKSFALVLTGAVLFAISDSFIAMNNFSFLFDGNKQLARILIMSLYLAGQYYIAVGCLDQFNLREDKNKQLF